jgi:hypothetical protein
MSELCPGQNTNRVIGLVFERVQKNPTLSNAASGSVRFRFEPIFELDFATTIRAKLGIGQIYSDPNTTTCANFLCYRLALTTTRPSWFPHALSLPFDTSGYYHFPVAWSLSFVVSFCFILLIPVPDSGRLHALQAYSLEVSIFPYVISPGYIFCLSSVNSAQYRHSLSSSFVPHRLSLLFTQPKFIEQC